MCILRFITGAYLKRLKFGNRLLIIVYLMYKAEMEYRKRENDSVGFKEFEKAPEKSGSTGFNVQRRKPVDRKVGTASLVLLFFGNSFGRFPSIPYFCALKKCTAEIVLKNPRSHEKRFASLQLPFCSV